jgi:hypothetical protein
MSLTALIQSMSRKEVLLPKLRSFLRAEQERLNGKAFKDKAAVIQDAKMTIACFKERISEYNHNSFDGEFFHPSQLGGCIRAAWFDVKKAPKLKRDEDLFRVHMIFETGTYIGVMFQNLCERAGVLVRREVPIVDRVNKILGHADGIVKVQGVKYVLEIKTINARLFAEAKKAGKPTASNKRQIMAYMKSLGLQWGIVVYLEKDRHNAIEYVVQYDEDFYQKYVAKRIKLFFKQVRRNEIPDREGESPMKAPCMWCPYIRICFDTNGLKRFMKKL